MSQIENISGLQSILEAVNALPDKETVTTVYIGTTEPDAGFGTDGDIYIVRSDSA